MVLLRIPFSKQLEAQQTTTKLHDDEYVKFPVSTPLNPVAVHAIPPDIQPPPSPSTRSFIDVAPQHLDNLLQTSPGKASALLCAAGSRQQTADRTRKLMRRPT
ncbi:hypothetical protein G7Y89_g822 [Cudoniella acicularis]|uniref:Uncharacterized protein n=1 Tax=Cudoniella acicularis TaxID=354080 RepID=A0A8H4WAU5_9HELO|nr:hypothetical protein G7Y89_g822 [Cudoniella acicularis]